MRPFEHAATRCMYVLVRCVWGYVYSQSCVCMSVNLSWQKRPGWQPLEEEEGNLLDGSSPPPPACLPQFILLSITLPPSHTVSCKSLFQLLFSSSLTFILLAQCSSSIHLFLPPCLARALIHQASWLSCCPAHLGTGIIFPKVENCF